MAMQFATVVVLARALGPEGFGLAQFSFVIYGYGIVFNDLGLNPAHVKFWKLENPETEPEANAVGKWAVENGFAQASEDSVQDTGSFTPTTTPEGTAVGNKRLSVTEWYELTAQDPAAAQLAFQKGRVDFAGIRQGLGQEK
jgi:hypothetical protein